MVLASDPILSMKLKGWTHPEIEGSVEPSGLRAASRNPKFFWGVSVTTSFGRIRFLLAVRFEPVTAFFVSENPQKPSPRPPDVRTSMKAQWSGWLALKPKSAGTPRNRVSIFRSIVLEGLHIYDTVI